MKPLIWLIMALATPAALSPAPISVSETPQELIDEINDLLDAAEYDGTVAVLVEQREPARPIFSLWADRSMTPASNNKLHTTAAALHFLGADHARTTRVYTNGAVDENGCLRGDLIVVGDGDPSISGRFHDGEILATMTEWIETLRDEHEIRSIQGDIIGDDNLLDDELIDDTWYMDELGEWYSAESSALSLNDNCVDIRWIAGAEVGIAPTFTLDPPTTYLTFVNRVETVPQGTDTDRYYRRDHDSNTVTVTGGIPVGTVNTDYASVHNPTLFFVTVLRETLSRRGISVIGQARDIDDVGRAAVFHDLTLLCESDSPPISTLIDVVNQNSQNFYADMLLKLVGREIEDDGSFDAGARAVRTFLDQIGVLPPDDDWRMIDGSGLSPLNRTTPRCLVDLLRHMDSRADADVFRASLPRGRADRGSLRRRFGHSRRHRDAGERVLGKTGYIGGVWTLTGIIENAAGVEFYYSIMLNGYRSESVSPTRMIDDIAVAVAASDFEADAHLDPEATLN